MIANYFKKKKNNRNDLLEKFPSHYNVFHSGWQDLDTLIPTNMYLPSTLSRLVTSINRTRSWFVFEKRVAKKFALNQVGGSKPDYLFLFPTYMLTWTTFTPAWVRPTNGWSIPATRWTRTSIKQPAGFVPSCPLHGQNYQKRENNATIPSRTS